MKRKWKPRYLRVGSDCVLYHAYWDGTAIDHSSYVHNGTVIGATFIPRGLKFDLIDDEVKFYSTASLAMGTNDHARFYWVYIDENQTYNGLDQVYWLYGGLNREFSNYFYTGANNLCFYPHGTFYYYKAGALAVGLGAWHLVGIEIDRDVGTYFSLDGVLVGVAAGNTNNFNYLPPDPPVYYYIGVSDDIGAGHLGGTIGEVLWFNGVFGTYSGMSRLDLYNLTKSRYGL